MKRLTSERCSGIKSGYWSPAKKEDLIQRLGAYEDTGLEPEEIKEMKVGQWKTREVKVHGRSVSNRYCSCCGKDAIVCGNYCYNCGAIMVRI